MALRIIRKSSSQSQVELIKGSSDQKPRFSLLCYLETPEMLEAVKGLLALDWFQQQAQCLVMKGSGFAEALRPHFQPMQHTTKLLTEPKDAHWSLRLRTLIQEAEADLCLFLPFVPQAEQAPACLQALLENLATHPELALLTPVLAKDEQILVAGQTLEPELPAHSLQAPQGEQAYAAVQAENPDLFYTYAGLPVSLLEALPQPLFQMAAVPLVATALRREAYLSVNWAQQDWNLPWLAQDLGLALRQKQYQLGVLNQALPLTPEEAALLEAGPPPSTLLEKWKPLRQVQFGLYESQGWQKQGTTFRLQPHTDEVAAYLQALKGSRA